MSWHQYVSRYLIRRVIPETLQLWPSLIKFGSVNVSAEQGDGQDFYYSAYK